MRRAILYLLAVGAPAVASAQSTFTVHAEDTWYLRLPRGARHGLVGAIDPTAATQGTLHDEQGAILGRFHVIAAEELDSLARVDELAPGQTPSMADHAEIPQLDLGYLKSKTLDTKDFLLLEPSAGSEGLGVLRAGDKGEVYTADGRVGAQIRVLAVGSNEAIAQITSIAQGVFRHDLVRGKKQTYLDQVLGSSGFANMTLGNFIMLVIGGFLIWLAIAKEYEPLLLVPIGFGILIGNVPMPLQLFDAISLYMIDPVTHEYAFNTTGNSVLGLLYYGVSSGLLPPLIFLGIGAMTDFSALLSHPKSMLLGAAAQLGIFATFLGALRLGFSPAHSAAIGIIGGADGPTAIFLSSRLAPSLIGPIAIAAYSYMAMVPIIQAPVMRLLTTRKERLIRMKPGRNVTQREKILFPIAGMIVTSLVAPGGLPLLGMLFFGNLLKESGVTARLSKTASSALLDISTILLGLGVGTSMSAKVFLNVQSLSILALGCFAFMIATAGGVLFAKLMNLFSKNKINPLIGAAGVSAVPGSARVVNVMGQKEDPQNYLLQHAMGPNVAGVIGSAIAAGVFLGIF